LIPAAAQSGSFYYDIKETDPERHRASTAVGDDLIMENLTRLHARGATVRLRCPIVPGYNDRPDHFEAVAELVRGMPNLEGVELMPYHRLGEGKLERLGLPSDGRAKSESPGKSTVREWYRRLEELGAPVVHDSSAGGGP
jgi:pyruvate formate lyase activating enzyme